MDNFRFDMTYEGHAALKSAVALAFGGHKTATHYAIRPAAPAIEDEQYTWKNRPAKPLRIVFYWSNTEGSDTTAFPFKMDAAGCADFAQRWLEQADYGAEPDHDGSNGRGWRVYNEKWQRVDDHWGAIIAVAPEWACYGK